MNYCIYAYTPPQSDPPYVSINQSRDGQVGISVRTAGAQNASVIYLTPEAIVEMANAILSRTKGAP